MSIRIKFLGGVRTVTGSSHLVTSDSARVLLDSGLFQGHREEFYRLNTSFSYNPRQVDALVISHAHVDHCGNLPSLIKKGMRCKIYSTHATKDLCRLMLEDSGKIQEEDIRYLNKINKRLGLPLRKPLYTKNEASRAGRRRFQTLSYGHRCPAAKNVFVTLLDAGHILGSALVVLDVKDQDKQLRIGYAVDLGRKNLPMLNDPVIPKGLDYLIIESTYGGREHAPIEEAKIKLRDAINRTVERRGKIVIPAFTLERTQEVIYVLNQLSKEKAIPIIPVFVDSPLATEITEVFKYHQAYMNDKTQNEIVTGNGPFELLNLRFIRDQVESKKLNADKRPMIIIAGSGMCESGRVLHHLKNTIEDSRNTVLVVGYMAKDTLGRRIVERDRFVPIFGIEHELNAEVVIINAFSGHADKHDLFEFISGCLPLKRIFLVHGDEEQTWILFNRLFNLGFNVYMPHRDEEVELV
ncbi:MAG TPA: MBL fold metallo-hydrolase [Candidatus Omnitrophota bacterium]|nr:MBL fold metallo-hydrolase [Candidatus Omnitrophota bacterium]HRZ14545.1 MBL fold metallo-hydrolase [Candidatus Omnitrophota bacterium]